MAIRKGREWSARHGLAAAAGIGLLGLLYILKGGPTAGQIATGNLFTNKGVAVTVTRASNKTCTAADGSLVYLGTNVPCVESAGLLVEGASTNLALQSAAFDNAAWNINNLTSGAPVVTANTAIAPDGTLTADQVAWPSVAAGYSQVYQNIAVTTGTAYTLSYYVRGVSGAGTLYTSLQGAFPTPTTAGCAFTTTAWARCTLTGTANATATANVVFGTNIATEANASTPAQTVVLFGAQLEAQPFATSYVPTTTTSAARVFDLINAGPVTLAANNKFSMSADVTLEGTQPGNNQAMVFETYTGASDQHFCSIATTQTFYCNYYNGLAGGGPVGTPTPVFAVGVKHHVMQNYDGATWTVKVDSTNVGTWSGSFTLASNVRTNVTIGSDGVGGNADTIFGWISNVCMGNAGVCQ